jgi:hypothetical protein
MYLVIGKNEICAGSRRMMNDPFIRLPLANRYQGNLNWDGFVWLLVMCQHAPHVLKMIFFLQYNIIVFFFFWIIKYVSKVKFLQPKGRAKVLKKLAPRVLPGQFIRAFIGCLRLIKCYDLHSV